MSRLDKEKKYRRTTTFALSLALVVVLFLVSFVGISQKQRTHDRIEQSRSACLGGNRLRTQIRSIGTSLNARNDNFVNVMISVGTIAQGQRQLTPDEKAQGEAALKEFLRLSKVDSDKVKAAIKRIKNADCKALYH